MNNKQKHETTLKKILRKTFNGQMKGDDRHYATKQLKKIYSQQFSKMLKDKKYELLFEKNKEELDQSFVTETNQKINYLNRMQERSVEKREKILKDRVKIYQNYDKKWVYKTEEIKRKFKSQEKQMLKTAEDYREKWQKDIQKREVDQIKTMKHYSRQNHNMFNSNYMSMKSSPNQSHIFNKKKLEELTKKRKSRFSEIKKPTSIESQIQVHQEREQALSYSKSNQNYSKLINKLSKMENIELKRQNRLKTQSLEKAKHNLNQRVYKNNKPEIGPPCNKFKHHEQNFRIKTVQNQRSKSRTQRGQLSYSGLRSSQSMHYQDQNIAKNQQRLVQYCQKTRQIKMNKLLKMNVRAVLNTQFKKDHSRSQSHYIS